jgi:hypothetical protein
MVGHDILAVAFGKMIRPRVVRGRWIVIVRVFGRNIRLL